MKYIRKVSTNVNKRRGDDICVIISIFILEFHIIVCGLDSISARRWINGMVVGYNISHLHTM